MSSAAEQGLSFIQITTDLSFQPAEPPSTETTSDLKSIPSSDERNGRSTAGSLNLIDIYLSAVPSTTTRTQVRPPNAEEKKKIKIK